MNAKTKRRRDAIDQLNKYHVIRLEAEFGRDLADAIRPHLDAALGEISLANIIAMEHHRDPRDLLLFFCQMLSDCNNVMEQLSSDQ